MAELVLSGISDFHEYCRVLPAGRISHFRSRIYSSLKHSGISVKSRKSGNLAIKKKKKEISKMGNNRRPKAPGKNRNPSLGS